MTGRWTWCDIDDGALRANVQSLRRALAPATRLGIVVKSDAYGHGLSDSAATFVAAGADWLIVHTPTEAEALRDAGLQVPILVCGPTQAEQADGVAAAQARVVVFDREVIRALGEAGRRAGSPVRLHLKVETGTHRQGVGIDAVVAMAQFIRATEGVQLEGACTHFADVEDGEDHAFARHQLAGLDRARDLLRGAGIQPELWHAASSAAMVVLPESRADLVRVGIAAYGMWPSASIGHLATTAMPALSLQPALAWRARVAQVKEMEPGGSVGYGRTWRARGSQVRRLAILPVGYHEGFPRSRSNAGHVLLRGRPAPVRGRVCMNLLMVDVTEIEITTGAPVQAGEVATLLGADGEACIRADQFADWAATIQYEIVARIHPSVPRLRHDS